MPDKFIKDTIYIILGILLIIFLAIQPYNLFCHLKKSCQPIRLSSLFLDQGQKTMSINFAGKYNQKLADKLEFKPEKSSMKVLNGTNIINNFVAKNLSDKNLIISSKFSLQPKEAENFLEKTQCLCFQKQVLKAGETVLMPVRLRINPKIEKEQNLKDLKSITVEYEAYLIE